MGWSSLDDFISEVTVAGKFLRQDVNKITGAAAYTAGRWYDHGCFEWHSCWYSLPRYCT